MKVNAKRASITSLLIVTVLAGVLFVAGCGGSDDSGSEAAAQGGPGGGMMASLTDEQQQCLEEAGVTLPGAPGGDSGDMPRGQPPEGMTPPDGAPQGGATGASGATGPMGGPPQGGEGMPDMEELQAAMEECGIDMPEPPMGGEAPYGGTESGAAESSAPSDASAI